MAQKLSLSYNEFRTILLSKHGLVDECSELSIEELEAVQKEICKYIDQKMDFKEDVLFVRGKRDAPGWAKYLYIDKQSKVEYWDGIGELPELLKIRIEAGKTKDFYKI